MGIPISKRLFDLAKAEAGRIQPASNLTWKECYTEEDGRLYFWFNKASGTTSVVYLDITENDR